MVNRLYNPLGVRFAALAALLALALVLAAPVAFAEQNINYPENGMEPVATFTASDDDGDAIVWSLDGADKELFTIPGGDLMFKKSPDFEDPKSAITAGTLEARNVYKVTVKASDGMESVTVTVTDVDEDGSIKMDQPQPQVDRSLKATLTDADKPIGDKKWQWAVSSDMSSWTDLQARSQSYTPKAGDVGKYLRVTMTYTDKFGKGKTASKVSDSMVEARTSANAAPSFRGQDDDGDTAGIQISRKVDENTAAGVSIGDPVSATDSDNDVLVYKLTGMDAGKFDIDTETGQIKVKEDLDFEAIGSTANAPTDNCAAANACVVVVTATDPSGATNPDSGVVGETGQPVAIEIENVNEFPEFDDDDPTVLRVTENQETDILSGASGPTVLAGTPYAVTDDDAADTTIVYMVQGADEKYFDEAPGGLPGFLTTDTHIPNYEKKSSYSITIVASSGTGSRLRTSRLDVTVNVINAEDRGTVKLSQREPQIGRPVSATLTDLDGGVTSTKWQWYRNVPAPTDSSADELDRVTATLIDSVTLCSVSANPADLCRIDKAVSSTYIPVDADEDKYLAAKVSYKDDIDPATPASFHARTEADVQDSAADNAAPVFPDQDPDTEGDQSDRAKREVAENTKAGVTFGDPVEASDRDGDLLLHTLGGADAASFDIDRNNGQLKTKAELDYETKKEYMVTVTATDPSSATDTIMVTINVKDVDDPAEITGGVSVNYPENGMEPVATFTASDDDGDAIVWSLDGADKELFTIPGGDLMFKKSPDFEDPKSAITAGTLEARNVYKVTVKASDGMESVTVTVTDVDEDGSIKMDQPQPQAGRALKATLTDADKPIGDKKWQWAVSSDMSSWTDLQARSQSYTPKAGDVGKYLRVTMTYTDKFGKGKTASKVSDSMVEARTSANAAPSFRGQDDDGDTAGIQISRKVDENTAAGVSIGDPVSATDSDNDVLVYKLTGMDAGKFDIDTETGQIKVKEDLDFEAIGSTANAPTDNCAAANACVVVVTATDPSGATNPDSGVVGETGQPVAIEIENVNEFPEFDDDDPTVLRVTENQETDILSGASGPTVLAGTPYAVTDDDAADTTIVYMVQGADEKYFDEAPGGLPGFLTTDTHIPNYEKKSSYSITIVASSGTGSRLRTSRLDVTVNVINAEDRGTVKLSQREPQIGRPVSATLTDLDGGVTSTKWQWYRNVPAPTDSSADELDRVTATLIDSVTLCSVSANPADLCRIDKAVSSTYIPVDADEDKYLAAKVSYKDDIDPATPASFHARTEADVQDSAADNAAPVFPDQDPDTEGDQSDRAKREVAENTKAGVTFGDPVEASDRDGDLLLHTLGGADAASFDIDRNNGQLKTKAELDYETKKEYMVTVTATDPSGATDTIMVTINVKDVNDGATITLVTDTTEPEPEPENNAPEFAAATAARSVAENTAAGMPVGAPVTATDADDDDLTYTLGGSDAGSFAIDAATGQIMTSAALDHETMDSYSVTVTADDGNGGSDSITVAISVTDVQLNGAAADRYDANNDEMIDRDEASAAITDYLLHGTISQDEARAVVRAYLASP